MERRQGFNRFDLHNDAIFHEEIEPITRFDLFAVVNDGKRRLTREAQSSLRELVGETLLINAFEQTRAECLVHLERRIDDDCRNALQRLVALFAPSFALFA